MEKTTSDDNPIRLNEYQELLILRVQVKDLQTRNSELLEESRFYKKLYVHARTFLQSVLLDSPLAARLHGAGEVNDKVTGDGISRTLLAGTKIAFERLEQLEKDVNTNAAYYAREFIKQSRDLKPFDIDTYGEFVHKWSNKFVSIVGDPNAE